jgi:uncharacterized membrane protein YozB (DUF420 family)
MKQIIRHNIVLSSIILFCIIFIVLFLIKPIFLFNRDGSVREFGVGYKNKTIMPLWLCSIILGILSYVSILSWLNWG